MENMEPQMEFTKPTLVRIQIPEDYELADPDEDEQVQIQKDRESKILSKIYFHEENIPKNPNMDSMITFDTKSKMIVKGSSLRNTYLTNKGKQNETQSDALLETLNQVDVSNLNLLSKGLNEENKHGLEYPKFSGFNEFNSTIGEFSNTLNGENSLKDDQLDAEVLSEESIQQINFLRDLSQNYRTVPCKNYHGSRGCGRSRYCHFIHLSEYEGIEL